VLLALAGLYAFLCLWAMELGRDVMYKCLYKCLYKCQSTSLSLSLSCEQSPTLSSEFGQLESNCDLGAFTKQIRCTLKCCSDPLQGTFLSQCRFPDLPHFLSSSLPIQLGSECSCAIAISRLEPKKSRQPIYAQSVLFKKTKKNKTNLSLVKYCFPRNVEPQLL
jgi:hypothetical protein